MEELLHTMLTKINQLTNQLQLLQANQDRGFTKEVLTSKDACWYLSCCDNTLKKHVNDGILKRYSLGEKSYYYKIEDLRELFSKN